MGAAGSLKRSYSMGGRVKINVFSFLHVIFSGIALNKILMKSTLKPIVIWNVNIDNIHPICMNLDNKLLTFFPIQSFYFKMVTNTILILKR